MERDSEKLIGILAQWDTKFNNGAVLLHFDKETNELKSISPVLPVKSLEELVNSLQSARNAIDAFVKDVVDKQLPKN